MNPNTVILSMTGATYTFFTKDYKPPQQERALEYDIVVNQNGKFKWLYDNGPGFYQFPPFTIACQESFKGILGIGASTQFANLKALWDHIGTLGMRAPEGTYTVHWAAQALERAFTVFPKESGATIEYDVTVQFEEAQ